MENGTIWCKSRPQTNLTQAHIGPRVPLAMAWPKVHFEVILGSIFRANVAKVMEGSSKMSLAELSRLSRGNGQRLAAETLGSCAGGKDDGS